MRRPSGLMGIAVAWFLLCAGTVAGADASDTQRPATTRPLSVGYLDWQGTWQLRSIFPLLRREFEARETQVGYVVPEFGSSKALWQQLRRFHVLLVPQLISTEELEGKRRAKLLAAVFKRYLDAGGGIFLIGSRLGENVEQVFPGVGLRFVNRGIQDPQMEIPGGYWWTRDIVRHQITSGVQCLAYPKIADYGQIATQLIECSPDWKVLVRAEKTARVFELVKVHTKGNPAWKDTGTEEAQPPLFAVRQVGKGRMAVLPAGAEFILWNVGNPAFPQVFMQLGDGEKNPSDGFKLIMNALRWLAEPALSAGALGGYEPPATPERCEFPVAVGLKEPLPESPVANLYRGLAGLHSNLSDGEATVAEYAEAARRLGLSFIMFADPWEELTDGEYGELKSQCQSVSNEAFRAVPGIQYSDTANIRWVCFNPQFLPTGEYLEPSGERVSKDGMYAWNSGVWVSRMPLSPAKIAPDPRNLWWYHFMAPWEYDGQGSLICDNTGPYLDLIGNSHSLVPTAYSEVKTLKELKTAANACVMAINGPDLASAFKRAMPERNTPWQLYSDHFSYVTQGPTIGQFSVAEWNYAGGRVEYTKGLQYFRIRVGASSDVGLREVAVLDGARRVYRRFLPQGARKFSKGWTGLHDRQRFLVVRVTDMRGRQAYSSPRVVFNNARGLYFCTDNQNSLQNQNSPFYHPGRHEFPGLPPNWLPTYYHWRGWDGNPVTRAHIAAPYFSVSCEGESDLKPGSRYERPLEVALASYFCNVFKVHTNRGIGPPFPDTWSSTTGVPTGETRLTEQEFTSIIPASRADLELYWFRPQYMAQAMEHYEAALALLEGSVRFKTDVTLSQRPVPITLAHTFAWGLGLDTLHFISPEGSVREVHPVEHSFSGQLQPGGFVTAGPVLGSPFTANAGRRPLRFEASPDRKRGYLGAISLGAGEPGQQIAAGTTLRFRIVTGFITDSQHAGEVGLDLAESLNLDGGTDGYPLKVSRGKLIDANFALALKAQSGEVQFTAGPRKMYLDLPVRIQGLSDNGCIAFYENNIGHFVFVPTVDGEALFQVAIDEGVDVWAGNVFLCDVPRIMLTLIGADEGEPRLEVHNPTDAPHQVTVTSPPNAPFFGGFSRQVQVPAGDWVVIRPEMKGKAPR